MTKNFNVPDNLIELDDETITISLDDYEQLKLNSRWLAALEFAGVNNWNGVHDARTVFNYNTKLTNYKTKLS